MQKSLALSSDNKRCLARITNPNKYTSEFTTMYAKHARF